MHLDQEGCKPLPRRLALEEQQVVFGVAQMIGRHQPHLAPGIHIAPSQSLDLTAFEKEDLAVSDRLSAQVMLLAEFEIEKLTGKIKSSNLAAPIPHDFGGAHRAADNLVDVLGAFSFAVDFFDS
jgi:hypothetical protein